MAAHTSRRLYTRDILLIVPQAGLLQIPFPGLHAEVGLQLVHLLVGDGIDKRQMGNLHVDFRCLFGGFNEAEGLVQILACAVDSVLRPDDKAGGLHLLRRGNADFIGAAEHPRQYNQEQQILRLVRKGDVPALTKWMEAAPAIRGGALASEQLRQIKNTFIVTATLASRAAIQGGLSTEEAFSLSDAYIQRCEFLRTMDQITNLQYHVLRPDKNCIRRRDGHR